MNPFVHALVAPTRGCPPRIPYGKAAHYEFRISSFVSRVSHFCVCRRVTTCWQHFSPLLRWICCSWASSSAGRAPRSQRGGRGFESLLVHQILNNLTCFRKYDYRGVRGNWARSEE